MKKILMLATVVLLLALGAGTTLAQSGYDLFQKALVKERAVGDVEEALRLYQRIVREFAGNRPLAAKAQFRMGLLYDRLGRRAEAQRAFQALVSQYADQSGVVRQAQARIAKTGVPVKTIAVTTNSRASTAMAVRKVWTGPGVDTLGGISADGQYLSHTDWETGDLAVRDLTTEKKRRLTNKGTWFESSEYALSSIISPDAKQVAYVWSNKDSLFELRLVGLDGAKSRVLYSNEEVEYAQPADWSQDGKQILALFTRKGGTNQIVLVSIADVAVRVLKTLDWRYPLKMSLSPDGRYIVYDFPQKEDAGERDIFILATDGSREVPLIKHAANDLYPVWTPDGKKVLFASDRTGTLGAWIMNVANGKPQGLPELVKPDIGRILPMGFTRKGSFFYGLQTGMEDAYTAEMDLTTGKMLTPPAPIAERFMGSNLTPDWSPDGKYLAYISRRGPVERELGSSVLAIRSVEKGEERELSIKMKRFRRPRWSPDGRSLLVTGQDKKSRWGLYRIDAQTGDVTTIMQSEPGSYTQWAEWSPDGKAVFFNEFNHKGSRITVHDLATGHEKDLCHGEVRGSAVSEIHDFAVSPNGQYLVFGFWDATTRTKSLRVLTVALTGGEPRELVRAREGEFIPGFNGLAWTWDGTSVLFMRNRPKERVHELWRVSVENGEAKRLWSAPNGFRGVRVHPDGRHIAFTSGDNEAEVWVMENFLPATRTRKQTALRR